MKNILILVCVVFLAGCVTVKVPKYLKGEFPYTKTYYASFEDTLQATMQALEDLHWKVSDTSHPSVFEHESSNQDQTKQILIFTEVRQTPLFLSSKYMSLNIYLRSAEDRTDMEIRYISVMPILFKSTQSYKNDPVVNKIFKRVDELLGQ